MGNANLKIENNTYFLTSEKVKQIVKRLLGIVTPNMFCGISLRNIKPKIP